MHIRALIIDDEFHARELLKDYLKGFPDIELSGEYADGFSGLKGIQEYNPELIFLDVQMPKLTGFELLEVLDASPEIIFTTAYDQFAIKAFDHNAVDYLLKPFSEKRFGEAVKRAITSIQLKKKPMNALLREHIDNNSVALTRIVVKIKNDLKIIPTGQILYIEAQDDYVMIYTSEGKYLKQKTMKYFETRLDGSEFIRIHRSYLVRGDQIIKLEPYTKDSWVIILKNSTKLPVSRSGYRLLRETFDL